MGVELGSGVGCSEESLLNDDLHVTGFEFLVESEVLELLLGLLCFLLELEFFDVTLIESHFVSLCSEGFLLFVIEWAVFWTIFVVGLLTIVFTFIVFSLLGKSNCGVIGGKLLWLLLLGFLVTLLALLLAIALWLLTIVIALWLLTIVITFWLLWSVTFWLLWSLTFWLLWSLTIAIGLLTIVTIVTFIIPFLLGKDNFENLSLSSFEFGSLLVIGWAIIISLTIVVILLLLAWLLLVSWTIVAIITIIILLGKSSGVIGSELIWLLLLLFLLTIFVLGWLLLAFWTIIAIIIAIIFLGVFLSKLDLNAIIIAISFLWLLLLLFLILLGLLDGFLDVSLVQSEFLGDFLAGFLVLLGKFVTISLFWFLAFWSIWLLEIKITLEFESKISSLISCFSELNGGGSSEESKVSESSHVVVW